MTEHASVAAAIARFASMTTDELRREYEDLHGEPARSRNRRWLFRRVAWAYQASIYGGLSEAAKQRLEELAPTAELALQTPRHFNPQLRDRAVRLTRDPRVPRPGTVLLRNWRGQRIVVEVTEAGFQYEGVTYRSLSAAARAITGTRWNGHLFFFGPKARKAAR